MQYMARLEPVAAGGANLADRAAHAGLQLRQGKAFFEQLRAGGAVDRAVDAAAAEQGFVGGVDDGVHVQFGDVALPDFDLHDAIFMGFQ
jgi:hypothetical protein